MTTEHVAIALEHVCCHAGGLRLAQRSVARLPGVLDVSLDTTTMVAHVDFEPERCSRADIIASVRGLGYRAGEADQWD